MAKGKISLKTPKGTRDWDGTDMVLRDKIFTQITQVFKRHGGVTIDTPVFELKEILAGKYGEDQKLVYDLMDQGGEHTCLRYDLTVPFARYLAMNSSIQNIKRYHVAKVYRRDAPAIRKGRMREFFQCDFDVAGTYDPMLPEAEIMRIICEIFHALKFDGFMIKLNHRAILDGMFAVCGVPESKIRAISSSVDKLDKSEWEEVRREMVEEKGLEEEVADRIWGFAQQKGGEEVLKSLRSNEEVMKNERMVKGIGDMETLFEYLDVFGITSRAEFNLALARGLDYYTGAIFEVVTSESSGKASTKSSDKRSKPSEFDEDRSNDPSLGVGSIAAGGRYDNLVGMFSGKNQIPCTGISFGVDRIFSIIKARMEAEKAAAAVRSTEVDVYVMALGFSKTFTGLVKERMQVCRTLWDAGIKAEFAYKLKPKLPAQFKLAEAGGVPWAVILGEDEQAKGMVKIKEMGLPEGHPEKDGVLVKLQDLIPEIKKRLSAMEANGEIPEIEEGKGQGVKEAVDAAKELEIKK